VGCTTLIGGAAHYAAVLAGKSQHDVKFKTGIGFFMGMFIGAGSLLFDFFY
jgi:hypothetical protein